MEELTLRERAAVEAVAKRFSATWELGRRRGEAHLVFARRRIAVDIKSLKKCGTGRARAGKPRLRFDKVVTRFMEDLQAFCRKTVPSGTTVVLTVTAPIRLASKTAAALEVEIHALVEQRLQARDFQATICGNRVRIRLLKGRAGPAPKLIGFVHNPETDAVLLLGMTTELQKTLSANSYGRAPNRTSSRWLVLISAEGSSSLEAYRYIHSQLRIATGFKKILIVFADGVVGKLTG